MISLRNFAIPALLTVALTAYAATWDEMDYGRFLTASFIDTYTVTVGQNGKQKEEEGKSTLNGAQRIACNKGIAIKLGASEGALLFDTDLCRFAGGWTGGFVKTIGVAFDGGHGPNPSAPNDAKIYFGTRPSTPGWSKGGDFNDPRKLPTGPGAAKVPFGPLPHDWAKYRGLFLHGDSVVVNYAVGSAEVLEMPGLEKAGDVPLLTRTFNIESAGAGASVALADGNEGATATVADGIASVANDPKNAESRVVIGVAGAPAGAELQALGNRIALKLPALKAGQKFKVVHASGSASDLAKLAAAIKDATREAAKIVDLADLKKGGPAHWPQTVTTKGTRGADDQPYVLDTIEPPFENPYKAWIRIGGFDFFKDGRVAVSTWSGDVWIGTGVDESLEKITWKRYATGIFQGLGLKIVDDTIYVLGRDQITRLRDLNGDGEADWYECFNNDVQVTPGFHEFTFDLQTDSKGNFYFLKGGPVMPGGNGWGPLSDHNGCIFKVSKDGAKFEIHATGLRAPNGMGVGPNDEISNGDNQGTWVPADYIHISKPGEFIEVPDLAHRDPIPDQYSPHLCWIPYSWDNSNGAQVWVTSDKWGPLGGRMLYLSYGKCALFSVLQEKVGDVLQGGVVKFPFKFDTGAMRARFNPRDGQLYVAGLKGWQTDGAKDAAMQRVRYTGKKVYLQNELRVTDKGIYIGFTNPLDTASASDVGNYSIEQWNYRWTKGYGSPDYKVSNPEEKGHDPVEIKSVRVEPDKKHVFLEVAGLAPVMQMKVTMNIKAEDGSPVPKELANTINVVAKESAAEVKTAAQAEAPAKSERGLIFTVNAGGKTDTRAARLVALYVPKGQPVTPFVPAGAFMAKWEGEISSPLRAEYTFAAEIKGAFKLTLNGQPIFEGAGDTTSQTVNKNVQLKKGANHLLAEFSNDGTDDAALQLKWWSKEFPAEPVPPTIFSRNKNDAALRAGELKRTGRLLFAQHRCTACHDATGLVPPKGEGMPELAQDAPLFDEPGAKYNEAFLAHWINDPHGIRPHSLMPRVFAGEAGKVDPRAADLAAYFASLGTSDATRPAPENAPLGGALFANFGCIACHTTPNFDGKDEFDRVPLSHVAAKWQPKALREFLKSPPKSYGFIRMPHFRLTDEEAERITSYLIENAKREFPAPPKGDATKGAQLMATAGCLNCHAGLPPTTQPKLADTVKGGWVKGCLAPDAKTRGNAPDFQFTSVEREALQAFATSGFDSLKQDAPIEFAERQIKNLRCTACHARDGDASVWSQVESEMSELTAAAPHSDTPVEGQPIAGASVPALTWAGEKLQPAWMETFIAGHTAYKPRPWMIGRMPGFATWAKGIADGLPGAHGLALTDPPVRIDAAKAKIGAQLLGETGGFNCMQCHALGDRAATAVFEQAGVNFAYTRDRIRHGFYSRWVLAPLRADPETKMPKFADDDGKTPLTDLFEGRASEQFDAIWQHLQSLGK